MPVYSEYKILTRRTHHMSTPFPQGGRVFPLPNQIGQITPDIQKNYASIYVEGSAASQSRRVGSQVTQARVCRLRS